MILPLLKLLPVQSQFQDGCVLLLQHLAHLFHQTLLDLFGILQLKTLIFLERVLAFFYWLFLDFVLGEHVAFRFCDELIRLLDSLLDVDEILLKVWKGDFLPRCRFETLTHAI